MELEQVNGEDSDLMMKAIRDVKNLYSEATHGDGYWDKKITVICCFESGDESRKQTPLELLKMGWLPYDDSNWLCRKHAEEICLKCLK